MTLKYGQKESHAKAASVSQAKRFIERWLVARNTARAYECLRWRARYSRAASVHQPTHADEASRFLKQQARSAGGAPASRINKVDNILPDDMDAISDVGKHLQALSQRRSAKGINSAAWCASNSRSVAAPHRDPKRSVLHMMAAAQPPASAASR